MHHFTGDHAAALTIHIWCAEFHIARWSLTTAQHVVACCKSAGTNQSGGKHTYVITLNLQMRVHRPCDPASEKLFGAAYMHTHNMRHSLNCMPHTAKNHDAPACCTLTAAVLLQVNPCLCCSMIGPPHRYPRIACLGERCRKQLAFNRHNCAASVLP